MRVLLLLFALLLAGTSTALAEVTQFKQQILPIDCVYEVIDVGTQKLRYLTPETCPVDPGPPVVTEPITPQIPIEASTLVWSYVPEVTVRPPTTGAINGQPVDQVAGQIETTLYERLRQNTDSIVITLAFTGLLYVVLWRLWRSKDQ